MTLDQIESRLQLPLSELFRGSVDDEERRLLSLCHPDIHNGSQRAAELFKRIQSLAEQARKPAVVLKGRLHEYGLGALLSTGDVADIYDGGDKYILKISRIPAGEAMLAKEFEHLAAIHKAAGDTTYRLYFPLPIESFRVKASFPRRVNVFAKDSSRHTLSDVLKKHGTLS